MGLADAPHPRRGHGRHVLIAWLLAAWAAPEVQLTADIAPDLRTIRGTMAVPDGCEAVVPLPLPGPTNDLTLPRTFPRGRSRGQMTLSAPVHGGVRFETRLPERLGALGSTAHGLFALGGFHPQLLCGDAIGAIDWDARVTLPEGRLGVLGTTVGEGELAWTGTSERVPLALPRRATIWSPPTPGVVVVGKGKPRRALRRQLAHVLPSVPLDHPLVVVEAPLRRRLFRHAPGVLFASDRAFRLTFLFADYHRPALVEGLVAADTPQSHPQLRDFVGRQFADAWERENTVIGATRFTRALSWVPSIDALLSSRRMAFYSETFREWTPSDPVLDDVVEVVAPFRPGTSLLAQVDTRFGADAASRVAWALDEGLGFGQALQLAGLDGRLAAELRRPVPAQDYVLQDAGRTLLRQAPPDAPPEAVQVRQDDELRTLWMLPGEERDLGSAKRVVVDPDRRVAQQTRSGDAFPLERLRLVAAAGFTTVNLTRFRLEGTAAAWLRGRNDTHNLFSGSLSTNRTNLVALRLGYGYAFGPLRYGITRRQRISFTGGPALVNAAFQSIEDGRVSWSGSARWTWSNRVSAEFPLRGTNASATAVGGLYPGSDTRWGSLSAAVSGVRSPHPRWALAFQATGAIARASAADRLLALGGEGKMASLPVLPPCSLGEDVCADRALERFVGRAELRHVAIRGASVPLVGAWGTELQVAVGVEGLAAGLQDGPASALGATFGLTGVYELFGADPGVVGLTAAWLLSAENIDFATERAPVPEIFLRWTQAM